MHAQQAQVSAASVGLPVELTTTVRADKAKFGDTVQFRMLEPVLLRTGVVIPADAHVTGHVLGAKPLRGSDPSWMVIMADRVEWKGHAEPLHAFIVQTLPKKVKVESQEADPVITGIQRNIVTRATDRDEEDFVAGGPGMETMNVIRELNPPKSGLEDVRVFIDKKEGNVFLISPKRNLELRAGTDLVLLETHGNGDESKGK